MAKKTVFQPIDKLSLETFNIEDSKTYGIWKNKYANEIEEVIITESVVAYSKLRDTIETETTNDLSNFKKAFVLPLCSVSADRIKLALKEHSIGVTNDYEEADFIVSHNYFYDTLSSGGSLKTTLMMYDLTNYYTCNSINTLAEDFPYPVLYDDRIKADYPSYNQDTESAPYNSYVITGLALNIGHKIKNGELAVVDVDTVLDSSANKQTLTAQLVDDITAMMNSHDDRNMAAALLPTIDFNSEYELLWQLAQNIGNEEYQFNRNKDVAYWWDNSNIRELKRMNAEEAILYYENKGVLNNKIFKYFEPICRQEIYISNREMYTFTVQVKPEYRKLLTTKDNNYIKLPDED